MKTKGKASTASLRASYRRRRPCVNIKSVFLSRIHATTARKHRQNRLRAAE